MAKPTIKSKYGNIKNAQDLGTIIKAHRKNQNFTLEKTSGLTHLSMRFLSELERGKETAELGKVLELLNKMGLEVFIWPRGHEQTRVKYDSE